MGTVDRLLAEHVSFRLTGLDRIGVAGYIRGLAYEGGVIKFLISRGYHIPSPVGLGHNHDRLVRDLDSFVARTGLEMVRFAKGESKEDRARPYQDAAARAGTPGVVLVGKAQEKMAAWTGYKDKASPLGTDAHPHFAFSRQSKVPDHWYFYLHDDDWGPAFVKLCPYAPYPLWIMANGHEWLKAQLDKAGVGYEALDNGLRSVEHPALARRLAVSLSAGHLRSAIDRWLSWLPSPLIPADRRAGFSYDFSIRQLEISDTAVFDAPRRGRAWFEAAIRDHLDLGRPEQVALVVDRTVRSRGKHPTPGRFATPSVQPTADKESATPSSRRRRSVCATLGAPTYALTALSTTPTSVGTTPLPDSHGDSAVPNDRTECSPTPSARSYIAALRAGPRAVPERRIADLVRPGTRSRSVHLLARTDPSFWRGERPSKE
jgi:hypothetical protein